MKENKIKGIISITLIVSLFFVLIFLSGCIDPPPIQMKEEVEWIEENYYSPAHPDDYPVGLFAEPKVI